MTLDLKGLCTIWSMRLLLWDTDTNRFYRYKIDASSNNTTWVPIMDRTDPTNECRSWQDIGFTNLQARYLRLTGTYNSDLNGSNNQFHVVEWEVYGPPVILTSTNAVTVPEGSNATFQVRLNYIPHSPTTVTVSRVSGDTDITVLLGASLEFNDTTWSNYQTVTLWAAKDPDWTSNSAVIRCSVAGITNNDVTAMEDDNTLPPEILTSADAVTVPEGSNATFQVKLNSDPVSPMTVTVSRVSGDEDITVQSGGSLEFNDTTWSNYQTVTLGAAEDADLVNSSAVIRCSVAGITNKDVTATEQDNDVINLALASRGSTITGSNGADWSNLIDGVTTGYTSGTGFGITLWTTCPTLPAA